MNQKLHIIVTSEEGNANCFVLSKAWMKSILIIVSLIFIVSTIAGIKYSIENFDLKSRLVNIEENLSSTTSQKEKLRTQVLTLEEEKKAQLNGAYGELNHRSQMIDTILDTLEIVPPQPTDSQENSGGPFESLSDETYEDLIFKVDRNLDTIKPIPLGYPVFGRISSKYGRRIDPLNQKSAFHSGLDLVSQIGTEVRCTAAGVVTDRGYNNTYGWYVKIDHGKSFETIYAHNKKLLVKKGDLVERGQVISLVGNTGRSTGPHLHYEIRYKAKSINPIKFMKIARYLSLDNG
ncbi:MAG: M23 family metallopeptidase [Proteobacteria bacterium]|nr:M23 family metallopeptidase [Pseudomonadota bacterium]MBU1716290.1 M23 family metallopeptidase [Pseudomonadota bacterium]